jgi:type IV secretion system protein VirD4
MIINQVVRQLTETMSFKDGKPVVNYKHRLLLLLDEFPALGRLDAFEAALAYIAGYGLKSLLIIQSLNQLYKTYTQNNSIIDNCHIRIVYTPNDDHTPEFISKLLGTKTETIKTESYSGDRLKLWLPHMNMNVQYQARALLTPGEVSQLPENEEIIFVAGHPPIKARKIKYYQDQNFTKRLMDAPAVTDRIRNAVEKPTFIPPMNNDNADTIPMPEEQKNDTEVNKEAEGIEMYDDTEHDIAHGHDQGDPDHGHIHEEVEQEKAQETEKGPDHMISFDDFQGFDGF